jgi:CRISPR-associated protein Csm2
MDRHNPNEKTDVDTQGLAIAVEKGIDANFIAWAENFGRKIRFITSSQIRNVYGTVKKIEMSAKRDDFDLTALLMLKPRLAYARARARQRDEFKHLEEALAKAIDEVSKRGEDQYDRLLRFCQGFEAILAYHRAAGGK